MKTRDANEYVYTLKNKVYWESDSLTMTIVHLSTSKQSKRDIAKLEKLRTKLDALVGELDEMLKP